MVHRALLLLTALLTALLTPLACLPDTDAKGCLKACEPRLQAEQCADEVDACFDGCEVGGDPTQEDTECIKSCVLEDLIGCIAREANEGSDELIECAADCVGEVEDAF